MFRIHNFHFYLSFYHILITTNNKTKHLDGNDEYDVFFVEKKNCIDLQID